MSEGYLAGQAWVTPAFAYLRPRNSEAGEQQAAALLPAPEGLTEQGRHVNVLGPGL